VRWRTAIAVMLAVGGAYGVAHAADKPCQLQSLGEMPATIEHGVVITEGEIDGSRCG